MGGGRYLMTCRKDVGQLRVKSSPERSPLCLGERPKRKRSNFPFREQIQAEERVPDGPHDISDEIFHLQIYYYVKSGYEFL